MANKQHVLELRQQGYTYQKIGKVFGISRQRIHQILMGYKSPSFKIHKHKKKIIELIPKNFAGIEISEKYRHTGKGLTKSEYKMYKVYRSQKWNVIHNGLPDFLLWRFDKKKKKYIFEWREVKKNKDFKLSKEQEIVFAIFKKLGFIARIDFATDYMLKDIKKFSTGKGT